MQIILLCESEKRGFGRSLEKYVNWNAFFRIIHLMCCHVSQNEERHYFSLERDVILFSSLHWTDDGEFVLTTVFFIRAEQAKRKTSKSNIRVLESENLNYLKACLAVQPKTDQELKLRYISWNTRVIVFLSKCIYFKKWLWRVVGRFFVSFYFSSSGMVVSRK